MRDDNDPQRLRDAPANVDLEARAAEDCDPAPSHSGNGWQYFPTQIDGLHEVIRRRADFLGISEVSRFASALMDALVKEHDALVAVREELDALKATVRGLGVSQGLPRIVSGSDFDF